MRSFSNHGRSALNVFNSFFTIGFFISTQLAPSISADGTCNAPTVTAKYAAPSLAAGFEARLVVSGLNVPRSIIFDSQGNLLVLEQSRGVSVLQLNDAGGTCVTVASKNTIVADYTLNHGLQLSPDSKTLYASSYNTAFAYAYDPTRGKLTAGTKQLVSGMSGTDHQTRTLLISQKHPNLMLISRGSDDNLDMNAAVESSGHSQIKSFDVSTIGNTPLDFTGSGNVIGWGLRNSVGLAEHPVTGGIFSVENSVDNIQRNGQDFHQDDPGEELNFHGYLNGSDAGVQGKNYGYPTCVSAWDADSIPNPSDGLDTGSPIAFNTLNDTNSDALCKQNTIAPRLTFQAHWAPLDLVFNSNGTVGYMSSHGSSDRNSPAGYVLIGIPWDGVGGQPIAPANSQTSFQTIMANQDVSKCATNGACFRPCGLTFDSQGRLWMTSDVTGEIYVITRSNGGSVDAYNGTSTAKGPSGDNGGSGSVSGSSSNGGHTASMASSLTRSSVGREAIMGFFLAVVAMIFLI